MGKRILSTETKRKDAERHARWRSKNQARIQSYRDKYDEKYPGRKNELQRVRYAEKRESDRLREQKYRSIPKNRIRLLVGNARVRARRRFIAFGISAFVPYLDNPPAKCACCDKRLDYRMGNGAGHRNAPDAPSIDRLDNNAGYIKGNVFVICFRCNWIKNDASPEELAVVLDYVTINRVPQIRAA